MRGGRYLVRWMEHRLGGHRWRDRVERFRSSTGALVAAKVLLVTWGVLFLAGLIVPHLPFARPIVYAGVAPSGWHNASLLGQHINLDYAFSSTVPGLILAHDNPVPPERRHYWRTRDGGVHWQTLATGPCGNEETCPIIAPLGGGSTFFAAVRYFSLKRPGDVWVTHDAGASWRQVTTFRQDSNDFDYFGALHSAIIRDGHLYMMYAPDDNYIDPGHTMLSVSDDDGASWRATAATHSALERAGWPVVSMAADYQAPHAWYRALIRAVDDAGATPMLEHSTDDGRTWTAVGPFGSTQANFGVSLATNPAWPQRLCAYADTGQVSVLSSTSGGHTFQAARPAGSVRADVDRYAEGPVRMGNHGDCYLALAEFHRDSTNNVSETSHLWRAAPGATTLEPLPGLDEYRFEPRSGSYDVAYMPGGPGLPARIVASTSRFRHPWKGWASLLRTQDDEEDALLLWTPVP